MSTIRDVALLAGVSITTVSHVVNNTRRVSADRSARVQAAIAQLGYQPNAVARSLRVNETRMFGMIVPDNSNPYFAEIARSIEDASFEFGYSVILCNSDEDAFKERAYLELLVEKRVDGIAFVATGNHADGLDAIAARGLPVVLVDRDVDSDAWDSVLVHNYKGGREAVAHLIQLGHRHIGCISGPRGLGPSGERVRGYRAALRAADIAADPARIVEGDFHAEGGYHSMRELLRRDPAISAVFACNDMMAVGALRALGEQGLRTPQDVALVGFDDIALASYTQPALTTIAQPYQEIGRRVTQLLVDRANGGTAAPERIRLEPRLVVRASCGAALAAAGATTDRPEASTLSTATSP
ncbi:MAG: LacI family transcriptional regulator [Rhizobacter sp.]|nr:LacI family transcriptional regulator [Rhizobacter sp.]